MAFRVFFFIMYLFLLKTSKAKMVPGMFLFGDSLVDVGNNNYLPFSIAKADFPYNGIDFPNRLPTGRFSNGKNAADFFAEKLGLATSPPYLSLLFNKNINSLLVGVNFASGASGILNRTGHSLGKVIPLTKQVDYYATVYRELVQKLGFYAVNTHLSKSLFFIVTGSNDILGYSDTSDLRNKSSPHQYVNLIIVTLKAQIKRLHSCGARKYFITGVGAVGCAPSRRINIKREECKEEVNTLSVNFNEQLKSMLRNLKFELPDIHFSYFDTYSIMNTILQKPSAYGFREVKAACCGLGKLNAEVPCIPISNYCANRSDHIFWDIVHPTEAFDRILVNTIFDGPSQYKFPINIRQLIDI